MVKNIILKSDRVGWEWGYCDLGKQKLKAQYNINAPAGNLPYASPPFDYSWLPYGGFLGRDEVGEEYYFNWYCRFWFSRTDLWEN